MPRKILTSKGVLLSLTPIPSFLFGASYRFKTINWILYHLLLFIKSRVSFSFTLTSRITFLVRAVCVPSPFYADVGKNRLRDQPKECLCLRQGAGTTDLCYNSPLPAFLSSTILKLFLYTQSVVRVFYLVRVLYPVRSLQSAVLVLYWPVFGYLPAHWRKYFFPLQMCRYLLLLRSSHWVFLVLRPR